MTAKPPKVRKRHKTPKNWFSPERKKYVSEMTEDGDTRIQGLIIWLGTTNRAWAVKRADRLIDRFNESQKKGKGKK